jgi:hypothetical protein
MRRLKANPGVLARRAGFVMLAALALTACGAPRAVAPPSPPPPSEPAPPSDAACRVALQERGIVFEPAAVPVARRGCELADAVALRQSRAVVEPAATLSCPMALALVEFDERVIQPAAFRHFGRPATVLRQIGAYSCRQRSGGGRLSEHASGRAIDIAGFEIGGGPRILVREHWRDNGPRGRFLREVARAACAAFSVVLTPSHDVWHADHLHFDIGRDRLCGM